MSDDRIILSFAIPSGLKPKFLALCKERKRPMSYLLREFVEASIKRHAIQKKLRKAATARRDKRK